MAFVPDGKNNSNRSFTSIKMDWDAALAYDRRLKNADSRVGFVMMQYANEAAADPFFIWPSEKTIAHEAGDMCVRHVKRSIARLVAIGWLCRRRYLKGGKTHNTYVLLFENVQDMLDDMTMERIARKGRQRFSGGPQIEQDSESHSNGTPESPKHL